MPSNGTERCPGCGEVMKEIGPAPNDGIDGPVRFECKNCPKVWRETELSGEGQDV